MQLKRKFFVSFVYSMESNFITEAMKLYRFL